MSIRACLRSFGDPTFQPQIPLHGFNKKRQISRARFEVSA